jgi:hypothetical protein
MKFLWLVALGSVASVDARKARPSASVYVDVRKERSKKIFDIADQDKNGDLTAVEARDHVFKQKGGQEYASYMDVGDVYVVLHLWFEL